MLQLVIYLNLSETFFMTYAFVTLGKAFLMVRSLNCLQSPVFSSNAFVGLLLACVFLVHVEFILE